MNRLKLTFVITSYSIHYTKLYDGTGTQVTIKGTVKGVIAGKDFNDALLSIWLGEKPVTAKLKDEMLGK